MEAEEILNKPARVLLPFVDEETIGGVISKALGINKDLATRVSMELGNEVYRELRGAHNDLSVAIKGAELIKGEDATIRDALIIKAVIAIALNRCFDAIAGAFMGDIPSIGMIAILGGSPYEPED